MRKLSAFCFAIVALVAWNVPSYAGTVTFFENEDSPTNFLVAANVLDGVGALAQTHLVNHVSTNWQSNSTIVETPGISDSVTATWGIRHWIGPHADDINPNPILTVLSVTFTDPGTNDKISLEQTKSVAHLLTTGEIHYDNFTLFIVSIKDKDTATINRHISNYSVIYLANHSTVPVPEPASLALFGIGFATLLAWRRSACTPIT